MIILSHPYEPNIITRVLLSKREGQESQRQRRPCGDGSKVWSDAGAGFEGGKRGHEPRSISRL